MRQTHGTKRIVLTAVIAAALVVVGILIGMGIQQRKEAAAEGPGRIRVSFKTVQGSVSWDTCYTPCGMCPAFNYTSITYPC